MKLPVKPFFIEPGSPWDVCLQSLRDTNCVYLRESIPPCIIWFYVDRLQILIAILPH